MSLPADFLGRIVFLLQKYGMSYLRGAGVTMVMAIVSTLIGCIIGFAVGLVQTIPTDKKKNRVQWALVGVVKFILNAYVEIFRGTPMLVQAMFIYYGLTSVFGVQWPNMWVPAIFIVSINTGAYMAETVRGGILSIDRGQTEGAMALGMTHVQTMTSVILPQALRNIMPQIGNNLIINIKDTCVLFGIGTVELTSAAKSVAGVYYTYFEAYAIAMVIYFTLTFTCSRILRWAESKMDGPENFDLALADPLVAGEGMHRYQKPARETNSDYRHTKRTSELGDLNSDSREGGR